MEGHAKGRSGSRVITRLDDASALFHRLTDTTVARRKTCVRCIADVASKGGMLLGLQNPAQLFNGAQDSPEIGPWTRWQGALDAELMVVGQDWGDVDYLRTHNGLDDPDNSTNVTLRQLLPISGFAVD